MHCPVCGAELRSSEQECARCAEKATQAADPPVSTQAPADASSQRKFAEITPYSGPYPPAYVQNTSFYLRPRPINIWARWIGLVWTALIPIGMLVNANSAKTDRLESPDPITAGGYSLYFWIGIWAVVAIPAFLVYLFTRRKSDGRRKF